MGHLIDTDCLSEFKTKLATIFAPIIHNHAAGDIDSGTLSVARGGTGSSTYSGARTNLDVYSTGEVDDFVSGLNARINNLDPDYGVGIFTDVTVSIPAASWTEDTTNHVWTYVYQNPIITERSGIEVFYNQSYRTALQGDIYVEKNPYVEGTIGSATFTTNRAPITGQTLTCTLRVIDSIQGIVSIDKGGTGAGTAAAARTNLEVPDMGIVESGSAATQAITAGQYVVWKGALYTADSNISIGDTLAASGGSKNLTAVSNGGLNSILSPSGFKSFSMGGNGTIKSGGYIKLGNIVIVQARIQITNSTQVIGSGLPAPANKDTSALSGGYAPLIFSNSSYRVYMDGWGSIVSTTNVSPEIYQVGGIYICE